MELISAKGLTRTRELSIFQLNNPEGEATTLIRFASPASIAGTALLDSPEADGMWIYLPALNRARRVSSSNGGGSFVNSQFFYEDLKQRHPNDDHHVFAEPGNYEGIDTVTLVSTPQDPDESAYTARKSWIHPELLLPLRIDFYEDDSEPSKRLEVLQIDEIQGFWTVMASRMTDLRTMDTTTISVNAVRYNQNLPNNLFTTNSLGLRDAFLPFIP
jgi:outer membrane lipoprotein-sorting protein